MSSRSWQDIYTASRMAHCPSPCWSYLTLKQKADNEAGEESPAMWLFSTHLPLLDCFLGTHPEHPQVLSFKELGLCLGSQFNTNPVVWPLPSESLWPEKSQLSVLLAPAQICLPGSTQAGSWANPGEKSPIWQLSAEIDNIVTHLIERMGAGEIRIMFL